MQVIGFHQTLQRSGFLTEVIASLVVLHTIIIPAISMANSVERRLPTSLVAQAFCQHYGSSVWTLRRRLWTPNTSRRPRLGRSIRW